MQEDNKKINNARNCAVLWGSAFLFVLNIWLSSLFVGVFAGVVWLYTVIVALAQQERFGSSRLERYLFASLFVGSLFGIVLSLGYFLTSLNSSLISFAILVISYISSKSNIKIYLPSLEIRTRHWTNYIVILILLGDSAILYQVFVARTADALSSPWLLFGYSIFALFGFVSFALFIVSYNRKDDLGLLLSALHFFVAIAVSAIVFEIGFGFDPFIHRAAESDLSLNGFINPRQILYTGQYVLVSAIHRLTALPIKIVDIWLVPVVSSLLIPASAYLGLRNGLRMEKSEAQLCVHVIFLLPLMPLTFTVPFNITFLLFFASVFLLLIKMNRVQTGVMVLVATFAVLVHPLLGVPMLLFILLVNGWHRRVIAIVSMIAIPAMFIVHNILSGLSSVSIFNPLYRVRYFTSLFVDPYQHNYFPVPQIWEIIYFYRTWMVWIFFILAIIAVLQQKNLPIYYEKINKMARIYFLSAGYFMVGIFLLSTMFIFRDIIWYEQAEFSLRLVQAISLMVLPFLALYIKKIVGNAKDPKKYFIFVTIALLMTLSWYFSYPRLDPKSINPGVSVSASDVSAVLEIDRMADGNDYIVLSSQMMSAAALQEFGFRDYIQVDGHEYLWYALPTGGVLYQEFLTYMNGGADIGVIDLLNAGTGVDRIYTVIHDYTPYGDIIILNAKKNSDRWISIDGGNMLLFEYSY